MSSIETAPPQAPRRVPLRLLGARDGFLLMFGGIAALVGLSIMTSVAHTPWDDWILDRRAVRVDATIDSVGKTKYGTPQQPAMKVSFKFRDADGNEHFSVVETDDQALVARARERAPLALEYDPRRPSRARLAGTRALSHEVVESAITAALSAMGIILVAFGVLSVLRDRRLYRHGQAALATVLRVDATSMSINRRSVMRVEFEMDTPAGPLRGTRKMLEPPSVGARIWVLYDPSRPGRQLVYEP